jgi:hypothetical protein
VRPSSFLLRHLHVHSLNLLPGDLLLAMQVKTGKGERQGNRLGAFIRPLRRERIDYMLMDERRVATRQRVAAQLIIVVPI